VAVAPPRIPHTHAPPSTDAHTAPAADALLPLTDPLQVNSTDADFFYEDWTIR
jgi:hypothetical protein